MAQKPQQPTSKNRFIVIGEHGCGKSDLLARYSQDSNQIKKQKKTLGCEIHVKGLRSSPELKHHDTFAEFWDISGDSAEEEYCQIYFQSLTRKIEEIKGIIFIFDATRPRTLNTISTHLKKIFQKDPVLEKKDPYEFGFLEKVHIPLFIIGNKFEKVKASDVSKFTLQERKSLQLIFEDAAAKVDFVYYSQDQTMTEYKQLNKFVDDCIKGENYESHFMYNPLIPLNRTEKYKKYTLDKIENIRNDVKRIASRISANIVYYQAIAVAFALGLVSRKQE